MSDVQNVWRRFIFIDGMTIDLDKTMVYIRMKCSDDGVPIWVTEAMLSIINEIIMGAVVDEEEMVPLWGMEDMCSLGWFLRVHGQTSGNSMFEPVDIEDDEAIIDGYDSPDDVAGFWPSDESTDGDPVVEDLTGGLTDEDMSAAFWVLDLLTAPIGDFPMTEEDI